MLIPLLQEYKLRHDIIVTETSSSVYTLGDSLVSRGLSCTKQTVICLSGDGGPVEILNGIFQNTNFMNPRPAGYVQEYPLPFALHFEFPIRDFSLRCIHRLAFKLSLNVPRHIKN